MKNKNIWISLIVIVVAVLATVFLLRLHVTPPPEATQDTQSSDTTGDTTGDSSTPQDLSFTFSCDDSKTITATFHLPDDYTTDLALSDGRTMTLSHVNSDTGATYANADDSVVFANQGTGATLVENGVTTFNNCTASTTPDGMQ